MPLGSCYTRRSFLLPCGGNDKHSSYDYGEVFHRGSQLSEYAVEAAVMVEVTPLHHLNNWNPYQTWKQTKAIQVETPFMVFTKSTSWSTRFFPA